jgi:hypothetical protein
VTNADSIFIVSIDPESQENGCFHRLFRMLNSNFYGIDVSRNGHIAIIEYGRNQLHLLNSDGRLLGTYEVIPNMQQTVLCSGVCFSHCGQYVLCFSNFGIQVLTIGGAFICTIAGFGAKPGFFRSEGQIVRLSKNNQFAITDIRNNRVQIVDIDFEHQSLTVLQIIGNNCFIDPLGIVPMGNCLLVFSHTDEIIYVYTSSGQILEVPTRLVNGTRLACMLPDGRIVVINQKCSTVTLMSENHSDRICALLPALENIKF